MIIKPVAFLITIYICLFLSACVKKAAQAPGITPVIITPVTGNWLWVVTESGEEGITTPASTHYTQQLEFGTDGNVKLLRNDTVILNQSYSYIKNYKYADTVTFDVVKIGIQPYQVNINNDTLRLASFDIIDNSFLTYVKIN